MKSLALILAGGRGSRLDILSEHRAKPSVPFAGKYRIVDFTLSNCVNSRIYNIGVITQYLPLSLNDHIGIGKPWDLDRRLGGVTLLHPHTGRPTEGGWYKGTAHAVYRNINFIESKDPDYIIILSGDHIYKMDYNKMITYHVRKGADLTVAAQRVPMEDASRYGILEADEKMEIVDFVEKPADPPDNLASMGIYVFDKDVLIEKLKEYCSKDNSDFGHHIIPPTIEDANSFVYEYDGYWQDVGTFESYWEANLSLTDPLPEINLYDEEWKLYTRSAGKPPVKFGPQMRVAESLISNGAIINGEVSNSVISPGVVVEEGAVVRDSIIFNDAIVKNNSIVSKCIIDKNVIIGANSHLGFGDDFTPNLEKSELLKCGLNVIGKGARIPSNTQLGRNCRVFPDVSESDFEGRVVDSGSTIRPEDSGPDSTVDS
ncbi:glucose-1-phosphate adenylyltransferase [Fuchsiella alkaliacetigena]|uniref:glucose-1-phosphate adenylyltransferase n=1 Tax=Fuchsiella alkaliacetigena TaxID=957042 RepID=UPI00200B7371|nr:glucose-1-phosphate adenylyltransferase [Fuchsiella alkaliacetigena]MCK8823907.1 glucose-1-phosphate adenylyltransferase [Fuchsiella alkaliacetigena]